MNQDRPRLAPPPFIREIAARFAAARLGGRGGDMSDDSIDVVEELVPPLSTLMEEMMDIDERPFLLAHRRLQRPTVQLDRDSLQTGALLREGAFTQTFICRGLPTTTVTSTNNNNDLAMESQSEHSTRSRRRRNNECVGPDPQEEVSRSELGESSHQQEQAPITTARQQQYTIKCLRHTRHEDSLTNTRQLLLEALYLNILDHPAIIPLRAFPNPTDTQVFVVTDLMEETLEDRIVLWRQQRRQREELEDKHYRKERKRIDRLNKQKTRRRSCDTPEQQKIRQQNAFLVQTPTPYEDEVQSLYPENLIALKTNYALQLCEALAFLHARGIVVCNLRPDTIGFKNHHTLQIMDLTRARELPMDEENPTLPATEVAQAAAPDTGDISESRHSTMCASGMDDSSTWWSVPFGKRTSSAPAPVPTTDSSSGSSWGSSWGSSAAWPDMSHNDSSQSAFGQRRRKAPLSPSISPSYHARRCYRAPEMYVDANATPGGNNNRFNDRADSYSWSMIFYEMLAVRRSFPQSTSSSEQDHVHRVRNQKLRPSFKQCYFPLTIQEILQQAWLPSVQRRWSASQISKSLTGILPVLEGQGLHTAATRRRHSTNTTMAKAPLTLPERAAKVVHSKEAKGWDQVRQIGARGGITTNDVK